MREVGVEGRRRAGRGPFDFEGTYIEELGLEGGSELGGEPDVLEA